LTRYIRRATVGLDWVYLKTRGGKRKMMNVLRVNFLLLVSFLLGMLFIPVKYVDMVTDYFFGLSCNSSDDIAILGLLFIVAQLGVNVIGYTFWLLFIQKTETTN